MRNEISKVQKAERVNAALRVEREYLVKQNNGNESLATSAIDEFLRLSTVHSKARFYDILARSEPVTLGR